nr:PaaI family thioesterase [Parvibaculum indicum]
MSPARRSGSGKSTRNPSRARRPDRRPRAARIRTGRELHRKRRSVSKGANEDAAENRNPDEWESAAAITLGKEVLETDRQRGHIRAAYFAGDHFLNRGGRIYGGFLAAMLDGLCGHAVRLTHPADDPEMPQVTLELKTSFIGRADPGRLVGEGWVRHRGRAIAFAEAELRNEAGDLVARGSATFKVGR